MSDVPAELLNQVPSNLHEAVTNHWDDWCQSCESKNISSEISYPLSRIGLIWACSDFSARSCIRYPGAVHELIDEGVDVPRSLDDYRAIVSDALDAKDNDVEIMRILRLVRQKEMLRIAWRDLDELAAQDQILLELSNLAEAIVAETLDCLHEDTCSVFGDPMDESDNVQRLLVLAMGKLGGAELNFSSDIDLIFCYPQDGDTRGGRRSSIHEFFTRLAQRLVKILNEVTQDGFVYRVDTRLRPYGESGPIVSSFSAMEQYYQQQGREWERYAMIKAKIISGRDEDVSYLKAMLRPFVFRRYLDYSVFESIREMKSMINAEVKRKGIMNNIKLGSGGIREIEFIGQTFQLIRGGRDVELQIRSIIKVLDKLSKLKCLTEAEVDSLKDAYYFHRKLENRLQMERDQQTHMLPDDLAGQERISLAMKFDSWQQLSPVIEKHRSNVSSVFQHIMSFEEESEDTDKALSAFWLDTDTDEIFLEWLQEIGVAERDLILESLKGFRANSRIQALTETANNRLIKLLSNVLFKLGPIAEPATVLNRILDVLIAIIGRQVYINLLLEYPRVLDLMSSLFVRSNWFAKQLALYPILLDELIDNEYLHTISHREDLVIELDYLLSSVSEDDLEVQMERLRYFKQAQVLKVAALDVNDKIDVTQVAHTLSNVAEVTCQKVLALVWSTMVEKHGQPECTVNNELRNASMGIIAYGKLGGDELGYSSDLDIVFVHDSEGENQLTSADADHQKQIDNMSFFARVAQKVIHMMETHMHGGRLYEIDTRLRPDGRAGLMAVGLKAFEQYQLVKAWRWEHQALIRARVVAGDRPIHEEFDRIRQSVLQQAHSCEKIIEDVVIMREKMRDHLSSKDELEFNIKQDAGGLVDIEFITQAGVLCNAPESPQLLDTTSTLLLLKQLPDCGWLEKKESDDLSKAYKDYRLSVNRQSLEIIDQKSQLNQQLEQHRLRVTKVWNRLMMHR